MASESTDPHRDIAMETAVLVVSNLPFLFPSVVAGVMRLYPEALIYLFMAVISSLYHYLDQTGVKCLWSTHMCYSTFHFLDFVYAYSMIGLTASIWLHPSRGSSSPMSPDQLHMNRMYRNLVNTCVMLFMLFSIKDDVDRPIFLGVLCGGLAIYGLFVIFTIGIDWRSINWWYTPFVLVFYGVSFTCFFLQEHNYWVLHSIWHACVAIGMGLTLLMRFHAPCRWRWRKPDIIPPLTFQKREIPEFIPMNTLDPEVGPVGPAGPTGTRVVILEEPPYLMGTTGSSSTPPEDGPDGPDGPEMSIGPLMNAGGDGGDQKEVFLW